MQAAAQTRCATTRDTKLRAGIPGLVLAAALLAFQPARAAEPSPHTTIAAVAAGDNERAASLFGMDTVPVADSDVLAKWSRARAAIAQDQNTVGRCLTDRECPAVAQRLIELSSEGAGRERRAKVGFVNRAVDLVISPVPDEAQWRVTDHWSGPLETLQSGRGDCEDYAIVKYAALSAAGIPESDMKIVILTNAFPNEDHAVLVVRVEDEWLILDNRRLALVRDTELTRAIPKLVLDQAGVRRFVSKGRRVG